jgi:hypothetical protein
LTVTLRLLTHSEARAAGLGPPLDLPGVWPETKTADFIVWPVALVDVREGDVTRLCELLKIDAARVVLADPFGTDEISLPADARPCVIGRAHFRKLEPASCARFIALPAPGPALSPLPFTEARFSAGYCDSVTTGLDLNVFNSLERHAEAQRSPLAEAPAKSWQEEFVSGLYGAREVSFDARGRAKAKLTEAAPDPRALLAGAAETGRAALLTPEYRLLLQPVNTRSPRMVKAFGSGGGVVPVLGEAEIHPRDVGRLLRNKDDGGLDLGTGEVTAGTLANVLRQSRALVVVANFGHLPAHALSAASAGRAVFLVGDLGPLPFGLNADEWLFPIPREHAAETGELLDALARKLDAEAAGTAARAYWERVQDLPALLAGALES